MSTFNASTFSGIFRAAFNAKDTGAKSFAAMCRDILSLAGAETDGKPGKPGYPATPSERHAAMLQIMQDDWSAKQWASVQSSIKQAADKAGLKRPAMERKPDSGTYSFPLNLEPLTDSDREAADKAKADKAAEKAAADDKRIQDAAEERIRQSGMVPALENATPEQAIRAAVHALAAEFRPVDLILAALKVFPLSDADKAAIAAKVTPAPAPVRSARKVRGNPTADDLAAIGATSAMTA